MDEKGLYDEHYNMDEKGYTMGVRRSNRNAFSVHSGDRTRATPPWFISPRRRLFQLLIIFRGKKIQKNWTEQ